MEWIPLQRPWLGQEEADAAARALQSGEIIGNGPNGRALEAELRALLGVRHVYLTPSATHALEMGMMAAGIGPGDEVICPSFSFVSVANAIVRQGARPVFAEIEESTFNLDCKDLERRLTPKTRMVVPVHYGGQSCDMDRLNELARRHGFRVLEDAAQALGARYRGRAAGTIGTMGVFSFHGTKNVVCGEGGALVTDQDELTKTIEQIQEKGTDRSAFLRGDVDRYTWRSIGSSYVLSDVLAAIVRAQLSKMPQIAARRRERWERYARELGHLTFLRWAPDVTPNWHVFAFTVDPTLRDPLLARLRAMKIGAAFHFVPLHLSPYAREHLGTAEGDFPVTERVAAGLIRLPLFPELTEAQQAHVIETVKAGA